MLFQDQRDRLAHVRLVINDENRDVVEPGARGCAALPAHPALGLFEDGVDRELDGDGRPVPLAPALGADRPAVHGILHWTDAGSASWFDFAVAIAEEGFAFGLLARIPTICPVRTGEFPAAARRPGFSVLDTSAARAALGIEPAPWRENLRQAIRELAGA